MSLVGTRPPTVDEYEQYELGHRNDSEQVIKELVEERYRQKKTQQEMADITGVRASNIARFERASCMPTLIMLEKYANALGKHIEIRICEDEE